MRSGKGTYSSGRFEKGEATFEWICKLARWSRTLSTETVRLAYPDATLQEVMVGLLLVAAVVGVILHPPSSILVHELRPSSLPCSPVTTHPGSSRFLANGWCLAGYK